jgi:hypothetical protein
MSVHVSGQYRIPAREQRLYLRELYPDHVSHDLHVGTQLLRTLRAQPQEHRLALMVTGFVAEIDVNPKELARVMW